MWTFHRLPHAIAGLAVATLLFAGDEASAQSANSSYPGYSNGQSYNYGLQLPQLVPSSGQDEIRAVDGTTCRSSISNNGAYVDMGAIAGQNGDGSFGSGAVYGRLVVPIGGEEKRLDCTRLHELEVARLKLELELLQAGLGKSGRSVEGKASGISHALE